MKKSFVFFTILFLAIASLGFSGELPKAPKSKTLIVSGKISDKTSNEITEGIVRYAKDTSVGSGLDKGTQMGPLISQAAKDRVKDLIQSAIDENIFRHL